MRLRTGNRLLVLFAITTLAASAARAASPPDWVVRAAHVSLPPLPKDAAAAVLYSEQETTVSSNGEVETLYREAYKILRNKGSSYGVVQVYVTKETPLKELKGWSLAPDGDVQEAKEKDAVEVGLDDSGDLYNDVYRYVLSIPGSVPGNVVAYEFVQKGRLDVWEDDWLFQDAIPVLDARYELRIPSGWNFTALWANHSPVDPQSPAPDDHIWELRNVPAVPLEDDMPPWRAVAGRMVVKFNSPENAAQAEQTGSWRDLGLWTAGIVSGAPDPTPAIQQEVAALTANSPQSLDKIKAVASFVQQNIRYVAIEIGIGGYRPHPAGLIFADRYGDCKDKATLLASMLRVIGVKSYYAVAQSERGIIQPDLPSLTSFDHMILAIQLPPGVDADGLNAVVDDPKLGKLLFFDPTDNFVPFGDLPASLQDNFVLLVAPDGGELVHLPLAQPVLNRLMRLGTFTLGVEGDLTGQVRELRWGNPAAYGRAEYLETAPADRSKILDRFLGRYLDQFDLLSATLGNLQQIADNFVVDYSFEAQGYARTAGNLILLRADVLGGAQSLPSLAGPSRKYPVEFDGTEYGTDDYHFTLPPGYAIDELPPAVDIVSPGISYHSKITAQGGVIEYQRTFIIDQDTIPVDHLADFRVAAAKIAEADQATIVLRRPGN